MKERFESSGDDLECCLPFQMRPNFGAICLSSLIRLPHEIIVSSIGAFPVPKGFGTGRIGGIEWVDGANTRCNRELAWMTAPRMLIAPDRTHRSYWPNIARLLVNFRPATYSRKWASPFAHIIGMESDRPFGLCLAQNLAL